MTVYSNYHIRGPLRFCEHCQTLKPRNKAKAQRGWKCDDCKKGAGK